MAESPSTSSVKPLAERVLAEHQPTAALGLAVGRWRVVIESNSEALVTRLGRYFRHFRGDGGEPDCVIHAIEMDEPDFGLEFDDWKRDPGKVGRKDTYADLDDGRVCRKFRTGMQFLMAGGVRMAVGPCLANDNQVINFVNSQYITWMLRQDHALCHAAAVAQNGRGIAMAGFSGGGKSTLALHLMSRGLDFVSNDRLLVRRSAGGVMMSGVPKLPRINPGTAINNPHLTDILPAERRAELGRLDRGELWELEEKYDVEIDEAFPGARFEIEAPLDAFLILSWKHDAAGPATIEAVDLRERRDLLAAIMKSPGPFHEPPDGAWPKQMIELDEGAYVDRLRDVHIFEISGSVDFDAAVEFCMDLIGETEQRTS